MPLSPPVADCNGDGLYYPISQINHSPAVVLNSLDRSSAVYFQSLFEDVTSFCSGPTSPSLVHLSAYTPLITPGLLLSNKHKECKLRSIGPPETHIQSLHSLSVPYSNNAISSELRWVTNEKQKNFKSWLRVKVIITSHLKQRETGLDIFQWQGLFSTIFASFTICSISNKKNWIYPSIRTLINFRFHIDNWEVA